MSKTVLNFTVYLKHNGQHAYGVKQRPSEYAFAASAYRDSSVFLLSGQAVMTDAEQAASAEDEAAAEAIARGAWAFQQLADDLCYDALDPAWHVRHGAALALREILRSQAGAAGIEMPLSAEPSGEGGTGSMQCRLAVACDLRAVHPTR